ncbi:DUF4169 family protein [Polycladidibacter stylochi]|uniref:DUF4169 family protein n=1 Tax=Polycladidibacter stylochi TaxID=1807766 RepID=UPI0008311295|nr:DUF4169 family protein [Pseudovibrio stylochi]
MTTKLVNLNQVRKQKNKQLAQKKAEENRVYFGLTKQQRKALQQENKRQQQTHLAHKREPSAIGDPVSPVKPRTKPNG